MSGAIAVLDEAMLRRIVSEELARQLESLRAAMPSVTSPADGGELLTRQALADLLGIGSRTLRRMLLAGLLPEPIRASQRAVWWPRPVIKSWMDSGGLIQARATLRTRRSRGSV